MNFLMIYENLRLALQKPIRNLPKMLLKVVLLSIFFREISKFIFTCRDLIYAEQSFHVSCILATQPKILQKKNLNGWIRIVCLVSILLSSAFTRSSFDIFILFNWFTIKFWLTEKSSSGKVYNNSFLYKMKCILFFHLVVDWIWIDKN